MGDDAMTSEWLAQLRDLATVDPLVTPGYIEVRDSDGKLLRKQYIGPASSVPNDTP